MAKKAGGKKKGRTQKAARKKAAVRSSARKKKSAARTKPRVAARRAARPRSVAGVPANRPDPVRELAKRIVDLTIANDDEGCLGLYAAHAESAEPGTPPMVGIDALRNKYAQFRTMTSNIEGRARNVWVDGNTIIIEWNNKMTFRESGVTVESQEVAIHEVENGKIVRERYYYDRSGMQP